MYRHPIFRPTVENRKRMIRRNLEEHVPLRSHVLSRKQKPRGVRRTRASELRDGAEPVACAPADTSAGAE